ncbi:MAG: type I restriction enzyme HsdR N-terminal domain-containing protein [Bacteroidia bacterium]
MDFPPLAIPEQALRLRNQENGSIEVWDVWRQRWIGLSPEEYVRQQFLHWLVSDFAYPKGRIQVEKKVGGAGKARRFDALVLSKLGTAFMLLEFKAPDVKINPEVFHQIAHYNRHISAPYLAVSNGMETYIARLNPELGPPVFCAEIPRLDSF